MKKAALATILFLAAMAAAYIITEEKRFLRKVLNIDSLPPGTEVIDRATWAWTDYREEYLISFDGPYTLLLGGRDYEACDIPRSSHDASAGLRGHEPVPMSACYASGNWKTAEGGVEIMISTDNHMAVVIYSAE